jgi:hypothetical protein
MFRHVRRWTVLVIVAVAAGAAVLLLTTRPRLDDRRATVEDRWRTTMAQAKEHIDALSALDQQVRKAGPTRDPSRAVAAALSQWSDAASGTNVQSQIEALNTVQGAGARLLALVDDPTRRYHGVAAVQQARNAYTASALPAATVAALNASIQRYNDARGGVLRRIVANLLGDDAYSKLATEPPPASA